MPARVSKKWTDDDREDLLCKIAETIDDFSLTYKYTPASVVRQVRKMLEGYVVHKEIKEDRKSRKYYS